MALLLSDAHTHLDQFDEVEIPEILSRMLEAQVGLVIVAGVTKESSAKCVDLSMQHPEVYAGIGIHPMDMTGPLDESSYVELRALALSSPKVVCISEVGLDFAVGSVSREVQIQAFRQHIRMACELRLPIIFHSRESPGHPEDHYETLRVLREEGAGVVGGAMHYFQWDEALASACLNMGFHVSLGKPLLRSPNLQKVVQGIPMDRILLETDTYPQHFKRNRNRWTEPKDVRIVAECLAQIKQISLEKVAAHTTGNLLRLLGDRVTLPDNRD